MVGLVRLDYGHPWNDGDTLHFGADTNPWLLNGHIASRLGEFLLYNEYDPRRAILFYTTPAPGHAIGTVWRCEATSQGGHTCSATGGTPPVAGQYFLNFTERRGSGHQRLRGKTSPSGSTCLAYANAYSDGDDVIFGDLGNDWLVGGTGQDTLWGGWGNDLMNADDNLTAGCLAPATNGTCTRPATPG